MCLKKISTLDHAQIARRVGILILLVQVFAGLVIYNCFDRWDERGQFGDLFGAVNASFSGLAFVGLIYAILLQREDLALQRAELKLTRKELKRSAKAQEATEKSQRVQAKAAAASSHLATTVALLDFYQAKRKKLPPVQIAGDAIWLEDLDLAQRISRLEEVIDKKFAELTTQEDLEQLMLAEQQAQGEKDEA